jgi:hypothetical protein
MFDDFIRLAFLGLVGATLVLITASYIGFLVQEFSSRREVVIEPFTIVSADGKQDDERGKALAQALQARLQSLVSELRSSEDELTTKRTQATGPSGVSSVYMTPLGATGAKDTMRVSERLISLKTGLLQPIDFKLSVAGLDVSGIMPWLQRRLFSRQTVHFALFTERDPSTHKNVAKVFGSVGALGLTREGLQLDVSAEDDKSEPSPAKIIDLLAHEIIRRYLTQETTAELELLNAEDFSELSDILGEAALAKRQAPFNATTHDGFGSVAPKIFYLADKTPNWTQLTYFAAWIADSADDTSDALKYYKRAQSQFQTSQMSAELTNQISRRIEELTAKATLPGGPFPASLDYSAKIVIRDGGQEGSVVGQALATALEFQIAKATGEKRQISARFIYYAARKKEGTTATDSGAQIADGIDVLRNQGAVEEHVWPYVAGDFAKPPPIGIDKAPRFKITDVKRVSSLNEIKHALVENGTVVIGVSVYASFQSDNAARTGQVPMPAKDDMILGGHAVVLVGYDDKTNNVKFANTWGVRWGDHGFGYLPYQYISNPSLSADGWTFKFAGAATSSR